MSTQFYFPPNPFAFCKNLHSCRGNIYTHANNHNMGLLCIRTWIHRTQISSSKHFKQSQLDFLLKGWKTLLRKVRFEFNPERIRSTNIASGKALPLPYHTFQGRSMNFVEIVAICSWKLLLRGGGELRFSWSILCKASAWMPKAWLCPVISLLPHVLFTSNSEFLRQKFHWVDLVPALDKGV